MFPDPEYADELEDASKEPVVMDSVVPAELPLGAKTTDGLETMGANLFRITGEANADFLPITSEKSSNP